MTLPISKIVTLYPDTSQAEVTRFLTYIYQEDLITHIYVAGAISFDRLDTYSDLDVHCVIRNGTKEAFLEVIRHYLLSPQNHVCYTISGRRYPWFGELTSIYIGNEGSFSIDLGVIEQHEMSDFYFQYKGEIVKDQDGKLLSQVERSEMQESRKIEKLFKAHVDQIISAGMKIKKDIRRGLFWNACENLSQLRRSLVFFICYERYYAQKFPFIGRPERDIEYYWTKEDLALLDRTIPSNGISSVKIAFNFILEQLTSLKPVQTLPNFSLIKNMLSS